MNPADITKLVQALQVIAGILQQLGVPGLVAIMLAGPAAVLITVLVLDHLRGRKQAELLETYRQDVAAMVAALQAESDNRREEASGRLETYRADMQTVLRQLGEHQKETAQYYRDNVELVKVYERMANDLTDVVVSNTRTMERVVKRKANPATRNCLPGVLRHGVNPAEKVHLTGKPVALLRDVLAVTQPGGLVLDPFTGGGTTGMACMETGRRFLGVELSPEYHRIATDRIAAAHRDALTME